MLFAMGCSGSASEPVPTPFTVTVTQLVSSVGRSVQLNGITVYQCDFPITVSTKGEYGWLLYWVGARANLTLTSNGNVVTRYADGHDVGNWFGSPALLAGDSANGTAQFSWSGPFTGALEIDYDVQAPLTAPKLARPLSIILACK